MNCRFWCCRRWSCFVSTSKAVKGSPGCRRWRFRVQITADGAITQIFCFFTLRYHPNHPTISSPPWTHVTHLFAPACPVPDPHSACSLMTTSRFRRTHCRSLHSPPWVLPTSRDSPHHHGCSPHSCDHSTSLPRDHLVQTLLLRRFQSGCFQ